MKRVQPLIEKIATNHGFQLGVPNSALLVSAANQEGDYRRGELLIIVWNHWLRYSVGRVVFGNGVRKQMGFTIWFDEQWGPKQAVNDVGDALTNMELAELEMAELVEAIYLESDAAQSWRQEDDITLPVAKPTIFDLLRHN